MKLNVGRGTLHREVFLVLIELRYPKFPGRVEHEYRENVEFPEREREREKRFI